MKQGTPMPFRSQHEAASLFFKAAELACAAQQVVAHRVTRMAIAGPLPSARDRKEFELMNAEKTDAFNESWNAMATRAIHANQALATSFILSCWSPLGMTTPTELASQLNHAALGVLGEGMAPVHKKALANAKRLARTKLR
jgi:hypothetical protein